MPINSVNGNTTPLGAGDIGTQHFADYTANEIAVNVSRYNYNSALKTDKNLQEFREVIYKMVSGWSREDKILQITEFGDADFLKKYGHSPSDDQLSKILTETIIVHLDPDDLRRLRAQMAKKEDRLKANIKNIESKREANAKKAKYSNYLTTNTFAKHYENIKNSKSARAFNKATKDIVDVPRYVRRQFKELRVELRQVLKDCYTNVELINLAAMMGIDFEEGFSFNKLTDRIINKVCLFVSLVLGKTKAGYGNAVMNIEPYKEVLKFTSYAYIVGSQGVDKNQWAELREQAKFAKRQMVEMTKIKRRQSWNRKKIQSVSGYDIRNTRRLAAAINAYDHGILADADYGDIIRLAGRYGIPVNRRSKINVIKAKIYRGMAVESDRISKLNKRVLNAEKHGRVNENALLDSAVHNDFNNLLNANGSATSLISNGTPIVQFSKDGTLLNKYITSAVPVWVVGFNGTADTKTPVSAPTNPTGLKQKFGSKVLNTVSNIITGEPKDQNDLNGKDRAVYESIISATREEVFNKILEKFSKLDNSILRQYALSPFTDKLDEKLALLFVKAIYASFMNANRCSKLYIIMGKFADYYSLFDPGKTIYDDYLAVIKSTKGVRAEQKKINKKNIKEYKQQLKEYNAATFNGTKQIFETTNTVSQNNSYIIPTTANSINKNSVGSMMAVYVMNDFFSNKYTEGIGSNVDNVKDYQSKAEQGLTKGKNRILFTKTIEDNLKEMTARGYSPVSAIFNTKDKTTGIGKTYPLKNADIEWALSQNPIYKFANGGMTYSDAYITGDARGKNIFANGAKPELVRTYSKSPVLSTITPIKKFADGGISTSSLDSELSLLTQRAEIANAIKTLGGDVPSNFLTLSDKGLKKAIKSAFGNERKKSSDSLLSDEAKNINIDGVESGIAKPVYLVNKFASGNKLVNSINAVSKNISSQFADLETGLGSGFQLAAPMGVGAGVFTGLLGIGIKNKALNIVNDVADTAIDSVTSALKAATGGKIYKAATGARINKFATGGSNKVIAGDALGKNIFRGGAKPELIESNSDITVTPLNKTGSEKKTKIERMTSEERKNALATAISSHVIKFASKLPEGSTEVSNIGEAIKVFNVKPGITDLITVNGNETSLANMIANIQAQLTLLLESTNSGNSLLGVIAAKPSATSNTNSFSYDSNPFASGFPSNMNAILGGN